MAYFLRFTDTATEDLERGTSIHGQSNSENFQILDGLCGYMLESDNVGDAIEEIEEGIWQFSFVGKAVLFDGVFCDFNNQVPDGDLFSPISILTEVDYEA